MNEKFELFKDLGEVVLAEDYDFDTEIDSLDHEEFWSFDFDFTDENFSKPSHILKPGDRISIKVFKQNVEGITTSEERLDFLRRQPRNIFIGGKGIPILYKYKKSELLKTRYYPFFDEAPALFENSEGDSWVPMLCAYQDGYFGVRFGDFGFSWGSDCLLLCFSLAEEAK